MSTYTTTRRDPKAKGKQLRRQGVTPCAVYGGNLGESISIQMNAIDAEKLARTKMIGSKAELELDGKKLSVLIKEISRNTLNREVEHLGFEALDADTRVNGVAHVVLLNKENIQGIINQTLFEVPYSALPADLIDTITIDMTGFGPGSQVLVSDLDVAKNDKLELQVELGTSVISVADVRRGGPAVETAEEATEA